MIAAGLTLSSLTLVGRGLVEATVRFERGLNVIVGPSDTGKTFIAECIDFALGARTAPKAIPEASGYEKAVLRIYARSGGESIRIERSLSGGDLEVQVEGEDAVILSDRHQAGNPNTISHFLLERCGLAGHRLRKNRHGVTRDLSFRDLAKLVLIDEERVLSGESPILSGQYTLKTAEKAVFRLLLTGMDDSAVVAQPDSATSRANKAGRIEAISLILGRAREALAELQLAGEPANWRTELAEVEAAFDTASSIVASEQQSVLILEDARRQVWERLRKVESRLSVLAELQDRFALLQDQYRSDLLRLEAIAEAGVRLGQMLEERCPVCGAAPEHHARAHSEGDPFIGPDAVAHASQQEALKIRTLLRDLNGTMAANSAEVIDLRNELQAKRRELAEAGEQLQARLQPRLQAALQQLRASQSRRDELRHALSKVDHVMELETLLVQVQEGSGTAITINGTPESPSLETEKFAQEVERLLRAWQFPGLERVTFSEGSQDIVISGRPRASHGKGVRAITHAAFSLGLLAYCNRWNHPHPGFVLLDSPLIVYREPDAEEGNFSRAVKDAFFRSIAQAFSDDQIVIIENDSPPEDVAGAANMTVFTGAGYGRAGFIPRHSVS